MSVTVRPRTGQIQTKSTTTLPLEFFDSPEMELVPPEQRLATATAAMEDQGQPGPLGYSRFYDAHGGFRWAPCFVLQYDRYPGRHRSRACACRELGWSELWLHGARNMGFLVQWLMLCCPLAGPVTSTRCSGCRPRKQNG